MKNSKKGIDKRAILKRKIDSIKVTNIHIHLPDDDNIPEKELQSKNDNLPDLKETDKYEEREKKTQEGIKDAEIADSAMKQDDSLIKSDIKLLVKKMWKMSTDDVVDELEAIIAKRSNTKAEAEWEANKEAAFFKKKWEYANL